MDIMELNDMGEYYPVEMQGKQDVMTGGIFMIKQVCFTKSQLEQGDTKYHNLIIFNALQLCNLEFLSIKFSERLIIA